MKCHVFIEHLSNTGTKKALVGKLFFNELTHAGVSMKFFHSSKCEVKIIHTFSN